MAETKRVTYVNFGKDWRTDFTIRIPGNVLREFAKRGVDVLDFHGSQVIRGWIRRWNGPMIELTHIEQLERIGP